MNARFCLIKYNIVQLQVFTVQGMTLNFPKGRKMLWNDAIESSFTELKCMVCSETLLGYPDCKLPFKVDTDELLNDINGIKTYIDDILILIKGCFIKHI